MAALKLGRRSALAYSKTLGFGTGNCDVTSLSLSLGVLSPCVLVQPDGWARGEREWYGGPTT